jgi:hypothetical protein
VAKGARMWVEIVCHCCAVTGPGQFVRGGKVPIRQMTAEAHRMGWRQLTGGEYECGKCTREALKRLEEMTGDSNRG